MVRGNSELTVYRGYALNLIMHNTVKRDSAFLVLDGRAV